MDDDVPRDADPARWLSPASYWFPEHLVESAWVTHGPFASWLIDAHRPRTLVELGTHNGYSYFAFLEAARRLGHPLRSWAIDSWEGDEHAGFYGEEVYRLVAEVNERYEGSTLIRAYFSDAVSRIAEGSVDLLHVDGRHRFEDAKEDWETYLPTLSSRAIVLFHDIAETDNGFGVHRLWDELSEQHPSFSFRHGHGLGVLLVGPEQTDAVLEFVDAGASSTDRVRSDYERLGGRIGAVQMHEQQLGRLLEEVESLRARLVGREQEIEALQGSTSWRVTSPLRRIRRS